MIPALKGVGTRDVPLYKKVEFNAAKLGAARKGILQKLHFKIPLLTKEGCALAWGGSQINKTYFFSNKCQILLL